MINKMREQENNVFVFLFLFIDFIEELNILLLDIIQLILRFMLFLFVFKDASLQKLCQIRFIEVFFSVFKFRLLINAKGTALLVVFILINAGGIVLIVDLILKSLNLLLVFLDNSLTEMRPLSELLFYFSMLLQLNSEQLHLLLNLLILKSEILNMLALVVELTG